MKRAPSSVDKGVLKAAKTVRDLADPGRPVLQRYPFLFTFLGTFGAVATFYGFERLIDRVDFLSSNPYLLLLVGLILLTITGTLFKKLQ